MREYRSVLKIYLFLWSLILLTNCNDSFQPLKENNLYSFNISGYLDASADTQWVRVGTIREGIDEPPDPEGIRVTLEDLQSGETVVMNDSVFSVKGFLNYWATMDINKEQTYRITAEGNEKKTSRVIVTTPKEIPSLYIVISGVNPFYGGTAGAYIYINDTVEHIADLQSVWYVIVKPGIENRRRIYRFPLRNTLKHTDAYLGAYYAFSNWERELAHIEQSVGSAEIAIVSRQFFVATGGPDWNENFSSIDNLQYFLDETASNVENGLGYVVGISSAWYRQADCLAPDRSKYIPCEPVEPIW